jgi:hypothetical protein
MHPIRSKKKKEKKAETETERLWGERGIRYWRSVNFFFYAAGFEIFLFSSTHFTFYVLDGVNFNFQYAKKK